VSCKLGIAAPPILSNAVLAAICTCWSMTNSAAPRSNPFPALHQGCPDSANTTILHLDQCGIGPQAVPLSVGRSRSPLTLEASGAENRLDIAHLRSACRGFQTQTVQPKQRQARGSAADRHILCVQRLRSCQHNAEQACKKQQGLARLKIWTLSGAKHQAKSSIIQPKDARPSRIRCKRRGPLPPRRIGDLTVFPMNPGRIADIESVNPSMTADAPSIPGTTKRTCRRWWKAARKQNHRCPGQGTPRVPFWNQDSVTARRKPGSFTAHILPADPQIEMASGWPELSRILSCVRIRREIVKSLVAARAGSEL